MLSLTEIVSLKNLALIVDATVASDFNVESRLAAFFMIMLFFAFPSFFHI